MISVNVHLRGKDVGVRARAFPGAYETGPFCTLDLSVKDEGTVELFVEDASDIVDLGRRIEAEGLRLEAETVSVMDLEGAGGDHQGSPLRVSGVKG